MARPFVPLADGAQAEMLFSLGIGVVTCRLWFIRRSGVVDSSTLLDLSLGMYAQLAVDLMPYLSDQITLTGVRATDWTASGGIAVTGSATPVAGLISGPVLSAISAVRIELKGAQPPRNLNNYNFLPGIPESVVTLNTVDATWASHIKDAYVNLIDAAAAWGTFPAWRMVCTSQEENGSPRSDQFFRRADFGRVYSTIRQRRRRALVT